MDENSEPIAAEIFVPAGPRAPVRGAASAAARYQQYVQSMSDATDTLDAFAAAQRGWLAACIEAQKSALDLCNSLLGNAAGTDLMRGMLDQGARYVLFHGQFD